MANEGKVEIEKAKGGGKDPGGHLYMDENVVRTIAGLAARRIDGIHSVGAPALVKFGDSPTRGVKADVGDREAAIDLDVVIEYGVDLRETAAKLRQMLGEEVNKMAGRQVVEVNINVKDIHLPEEESEKEEDRPRVQ